MATKTKYPQTASQTSGGKYASFNDLGNIKASNNYAQTSLIKSKKKSPNRPSTITVKKFKLGLPTGALATKVQVKYKHNKVSYNGKVCNIPAPTIGLYNGSTKLTSKKGQAPTTTPKAQSVTFTKNINYNVINSDDFSVKIDYPTNTNTNSGYVRVYYVQIVVTYKTANYSLTASISDCYNGEPALLEIGSINNNLVKSAPTVTITCDSGLSFPLSLPNRCTRVNARTITWVPGESEDVDTLFIELETSVAFPTGAETIDLGVQVSENLSNHTKSCTCTVTKTIPLTPEEEPETPATPEYEDDTIEPTSEIVTITVNKSFDYTFIIDDETWDNIIQINYDWGVSKGFWSDPLEEIIDDIISYSRIQFYGDMSNLVYLSKNQYISSKTQGGTWSSNGRWVSLSDVLSNDKSVTLSLKGTSVGYDEIHIAASINYNAQGRYTPLENVWKFDIKPATISPPSCTLLPLSMEEQNRLGDGYTYTVQSYIKENTSEEYARDWDKNHRIGVFNNPIGDIEYITVDDEVIELDPTPINPTPTQIIENAQYWSNALTTPNTYENVECEFQYNEKYPVYILITGDIPESEVTTSTSFTEPCIIESEYYNQQETNGTYPAPIKKLIGNDGDTAEIQLPEGDKSGTIVIYDWPLENDFGTNDEMAIRGLSFNGVFEQNTDDLILSATLLNDKNESRQRSIVLDENLSEENSFSIGQVGDLWGYQPTDITNLEDWETHHIINNSLNDYTGIANYGDLNVTAYIETIEPQSITCLIDGENLAYYGVFIRDVKIPEGLKTDTDYITVDGTDINDPYRQNIRSKTIEIEFDIGDNCDLEGATLSLRELAKLLTNQRDQYNRPIPKTIEFSHYPDVYWEYILEEPLDNDVEISSYTVKAKLTVPAGTSYDKETTSTNTTGYVSGLAAIRPVIQVSPIDSILTITESISEQEFNMGYSGEWVGKIVEIDCDDRIVWLKENEEDTEPENISKYVDINSDFFVLFGEYEFLANGGIIRTIDYAERW